METTTEKLARIKVASADRKAFIGAINAEIVAVTGATADDLTLAMDAIAEYSYASGAASAVKPNAGDKWRGCSLISGKGARPMACAALPLALDVPPGKDRRGYTSDQGNVLRSAVNVLARAEAAQVITADVAAALAAFVKPALDIYEQRFATINAELKSKTPATTSAS